MTERISPQSTVRNKIIDSIIEHLESQINYMPVLSGKIAVIDHGNEPACPEGITYVFPEGTIGIDPPDWQPEFNYEWKDFKFSVLLNPPGVLLRMPDLIYRIDPDNHVIGAGSMA